MSIKVARIDDRLIHGQVTTTWIKQYGIEQVLVINDALLKDQVQITVLQLTAPAGVKVIVFGVKQFVDIFNNNPITKSTMLIYTNPQDVLKTLEGGVTIPYLNVGGMRSAPEKKRLTTSVSVDDQDIKSFMQIMGKGVKVELQMVPIDKKYDIKDLIK